jgi:predicted house-cleaning noncanonical NTP pyrophosphatase (MazG superfamily)
MKEYNKLVRDKIPQILSEKCKTHICHIASGNEFDTKLREKLQEEVQEFLDEPSLEELADIQEVVLALVQRNGWTPKDLEGARKKKYVARGGFKVGYILEAAE